MKRFVIISSVGLALLCGCGRKNVAPEQVKVPRTAVTVTNAVAGNIDNCIKLPATTAYLDKSVVSSPIPAFVVSSSVQPGTRVRRGETLYTLESKERRAMGNDGRDRNADGDCVGTGHDGHGLAGYKAHRESRFSAVPPGRPERHGRISGADTAGRTAPFQGRPSRATSNSADTE